jgi:hypothetical protein
MAGGTGGHLKWSEHCFGFPCIDRFAAAPEQEDIDAVSLTGLQKLPDLSQVIICLGSRQPDTCVRPVCLLYALQEVLSLQ